MAISEALAQLPSAGGWSGTRHPPAGFAGEAWPTTERILTRTRGNHLAPYDNNTIILKSSRMTRCLCLNAQLRPPGRHIVIHQTNAIFIEGETTHPDALHGSLHFNELWAETDAALPAVHADNALPKAAAEAAATTEPQQQQPKAALGKVKPANCAVLAAGPATEPHPNACPWWRAMHDEFVTRVQVGFKSSGMGLSRQRVHC